MRDFLTCKGELENSFDNEIKNRHLLESNHSKIVKTRTFFHPIFRLSKDLVPNFSIKSTYMYSSLKISKTACFKLALMVQNKKQVKEGR